MRAEALSRKEGHVGAVALWQSSHRRFQRRQRDQEMRWRASRQQWHDKFFVPIRGQRMLLSTSGVFLALGIVTLTMMFGGGTVGLGRVFVVFGIVFIFNDGKPRWL
jgi:hypothetical protein